MCIGRTSPTAFTPDVAAANPFVIAAYPHISGSGCDADDTDAYRRRRGNGHEHRGVRCSNIKCSG
jgi:hypothetical protein